MANRGTAEAKARAQAKFIERRKREGFRKVTITMEPGAAAALARAEAAGLTVTAAVESALRLAWPSAE